MITLSKIAQIAHVSVSTVSKAFSMSDEVHEDTRKLIFDIAKEHGCFKKYYKAKYPKHVIAIICNELRSSFYTTAISAIQDTLSHYNCEICITPSEFSHKTEEELIEYYTQYAKVDGIIVMGRPDSDYSNSEIPIASLNKTNATIYLKHNNYKPILDYVGFLKAKNVTDIGYIGETHTKEAMIHLKNALEAHSLPINDKFFITVNERFEKGGYNAMNELFSKESLPRAILCSYDYLEIGAIRCIKEHGLKVPEDIAVMGIDNIEEDKYLTPSLSSIDRGYTEGAKLVAEALAKHLLGIEHETEFECISRVIYRESTNI